MQIELFQIPMLRFLSVIVFSFIFIQPVVAQQPPDPEFLFFEDRNKEEIDKQKKEKRKELKRSTVAQSLVGGSLPFDINAETIHFDSTGQKLLAEGNVIVSYGASVFEADNAEVDITTNEAKLKGNVRVNDVAAEVLAQSAEMNIKSGVGNLQEATIKFEDGNYRFGAENIQKHAQNEFTFKNCALTTCNCPDDSEMVPWNISASEATVVEDGYGSVKHGFLEFLDVPVLYFPYLVFPTKNERQSGLLRPTIGFSEKDGARLELPFFWAINHSTDATITPLVETNVRYGAMNEFRKVFSQGHNLDVGGTYLNESARGDDLLGTNIDGVFDPTIKENRAAGYLNYNNSIELGERDLQIILNGKAVSDDLFLREFEQEKIGDARDRYVRSRGVVRTNIIDSHSLDLVTEYNQSLVTDDDFVLQRLPEAQINGFNTFRPFGRNPLGAKLVLSDRLTLTNFQRTKSTDGFRGDWLERVKMPFYYKNFFEAELGGDVRLTHYRLQENQEIIAPSTSLTTLDTSVLDVEEGVEPMDAEEPQDELGELFEKSSSRVLPGADARVGTTFEKVFPVEEGNIFKTVGELGRLGRTESITRLKHTLEPSVKYRFVPTVNQMDNPQFDSNDRLANRNVVTYALTQRLFARYEPRNEYLYGIEETTPEIDDVTSLRSRGVVDDSLTFGIRGDEGSEFSALRTGSVREMATFKLAQSFDIDESQNDKDPTLEPLSDLAASFQFYPNEYVALGARTDYDVEEQNFSSYAAETQLVDKRGDEIRARFRFVEDRVRQLETGVELRVTEQVRVGYYSRYDDLNSEFLENKVGLRLASSCNCWFLDFEMRDRINPNKSEFAVTMTLIGLGELGNTFLQQDKDEDDRTF